MSISAESNVKFRKAYVPTTALAKSLEFDQDMMQVALTDGRVLSVPLQWFPALRHASREQLDRYEIAGGAASVFTGLTWTRTCRWRASWRGQIADQRRLPYAAHL